MLNLSHTPVEMLPKGTSKMRALRHLHLGYFPICMPAAFPKLESLHIHRMESLEDWSQTKTMCFLRSVEIDDCPKLRSVLGGMRLTAKLRELKLKDLPQLESISLTSLENISELQLHQLSKLNLQEHGFLQTLNAATALKGSDQHGFPTLAVESQMAEEAHENMNQLERLLLSDCPNVAARVADMLQHRRLPQLQHVQICSSHCFQHPVYPKLLSLVLEIESVDGLSGFKNLGNRIDRLVIRLNDRVDFVPEWIQHLQNLKWLVIEDSPMLTQLPEWLGEFSLLQRLEFVRLPKLRSLPEGMQSLTKLQELSITSLNGLTQLPESLCELSQLWSLKLQDLPLLRSLPEGMPTQLQELSIIGLNGLTQMPEWLCELSQLSSLKLQDLPLLRSLPEMMQPLLHLQTLRITKCPGLRHLPEWIGQLTKLADLELRSLPGLSSLPEGLGRLRSLRWVTLKDMTELTSLPNGMRDLPELQLDIKDCHQLVQHSANVIERRVSGN